MPTEGKSQMLLNGIVCPGDGEDVKSEGLDHRKDLETPHCRRSLGKSMVGRNRVADGYP